jgi:hypothetical protein
VENPRIFIVSLPTYLDIRGHKAQVLEARWKILELTEHEAVIVSLPTYLYIRGHKAKVLEARWKILELSLSIFPLTFILEATRLRSSMPGGKPRID